MSDSTSPAKVVQEYMTPVGRMIPDAFLEMLGHWAATYPAGLTIPPAARTAICACPRRTLAAMAKLIVRLGPR
jgi:hypothetical protein